MIQSSALSRFETESNLEPQTHQTSGKNEKETTNVVEKIAEANKTRLDEEKQNKFLSEVSAEIRKESETAEETVIEREENETVHVEESIQTPNLLSTAISLKPFVDAKAIERQESETNTKKSIAHFQTPRMPSPSKQAAKRLDTNSGSTMTANTFLSANGTQIHISKEAEDASWRAFFEDPGEKKDDAEESEVVSPNRNLSKRKRPAEITLPERRTSKGFKAPRSQPPKPILKTNKPQPVPSTSKPSIHSFVLGSDALSKTKEKHFESRASFAEFGTQDPAWAPTGFFKPQPTFRRATIGATLPKPSIQTIRSRKVWRPSINVHRNISSLEDVYSPLERISKESPFDPNASILPMHSMKYVFENGTCALTMYGAMLDVGLLPTLQWVKRQYQWIIWKLSGYQSDIRLLTEDNVFLELRYRLEAEKKREAISILKEIAEGKIFDCVVLLVANVVKRESVQSALELTDGWSLLTADVDSALEEKIHSEKISSGRMMVVQKLRIHKSNSENAFEATLEMDQCLPVSNETLSGLADSRSFFRPLSWIVREGYVEKTCVCIVQKRKVVFESASKDGKMLVSLKEHEKQLEAYTQAYEEIKAFSKEQVQEQEMEHFKSIIQRNKLGKAVDKIELLYARCLISGLTIDDLPSNEKDELGRFKQQHERSLELCLQKQMEQCMKECDLKAPIATPCLKLLVAEVTPYEDPEKTPMEMEIQMSDAEIEKTIHEGDVYEFEDVSVLKGTETKWMLRVGSKSVFKKIHRWSSLPKKLFTQFVPKTQI